MFATNLSEMLIAIDHTSRTSQPLLNNVVAYRDVNPFDGDRAIERLMASESREIESN